MMSAKQWQMLVAAESQHPKVVAASNASGKDTWPGTARERRRVSIAERKGITQLFASEEKNQ